MRELKGYREDYYYFSGKASDVARTLALSGLAVIWIFRETTERGPSLPEQFFWPALLIVIALAADLLQYTIAAATWGHFARSREKKGIKPDTKVSANPKLNWPTLFLFWAKLAATVAAYYFLLTFLLQRLFPAAG